MFGRVRRGDALDVLSSKEKHGTHVAGIIAANGDVKGVNPHARIVGVRVTLPDSGSSTGESVYTSGIVRGLGWMVEAKRDYGVNIEGFNLSIAGPTGVTYAARAAFKLAEENGIVGFVAAGNFAANVDEGDNLLSAVQQGSTVVVDSADTTGDTSWFSNYGKINTDVFSPGRASWRRCPTIFPSTIPLSPSATARRSFTKGSKRRGLPATPTTGMWAAV